MPASLAGFHPFPGSFLSSSHGCSSSPSFWQFTPSLNNDVYLFPFFLAFSTLGSTPRTVFLTRRFFSKRNTSPSSPPLPFHSCEVSISPTPERTKSATFKPSFPPPSQQEKRRPFFMAGVECLEAHTFTYLCLSSFFWFFDIFWLLVLLWLNALVRFPDIVFSPVLASCLPLWVVSFGCRIPLTLASGPSCHHLIGFFLFLSPRTRWVSLHSS